MCGLLRSQNKHGLSKREHPGLKSEWFAAEGGIAKSTAGFEAALQEQRWHTRVLQVSSLVDGVLLDDVDGDVAETVGHESLSKLFLLTLLTGCEDAKGDNFIVDATGRLVGIDNDLGFVLLTWA